VTPAATAHQRCHVRRRVVTTIEAWVGTARDRWSRRGRTEPVDREVRVEAVGVTDAPFACLSPTMAGHAQGATRVSEEPGKNIGSRSRPPHTGRRERPLMALVRRFGRASARLAVVRTASHSRAARSAIGPGGSSGAAAPAGTRRQPSLPVPCGSGFSPAGVWSTLAPLASWWLGSGSLADSASFPLASPGSGVSAFSPGGVKSELV
jgi:hypothetical protein